MNCKAQFKLAKLCRTEICFNPGRETLTCFVSDSLCCDKMYFQRREWLRLVTSHWRRGCQTNHHRESSSSQLQEIIAGSIAGALACKGQRQGGGGAVAAVAGNLPPCTLGMDKNKRFQQFRDWRKPRWNSLTSQNLREEILSDIERKTGI